MQFCLQEIRFFLMLHPKRLRLCHILTIPRHLPVKCIYHEFLSSVSLLRTARALGILEYMKITREGKVSINPNKMCQAKVLTYLPLCLKIFNLIKWSHQCLYTTITQNSDSSHQKDTKMIIYKNSIQLGVFRKVPPRRSIQESDKPC